MKLNYIALLAATSVASLPIMASDSAVDAVSQFVYPVNKAASPESFTYMPSGTTYAMLAADGQSILVHDVTTGNIVESLLDLSQTRETRITDIEGFTLSNDASKILVWRNKKSVYRRSYTAEYYVYEVRSKILRPLSKDFTSVQSPIFSPDSRMVAFVANNNIFIKKLDYQTEVAVTTDGLKNSIINGIPDWTYEEEFTTTCSMAWAPDNLTLCYLKYNEASVPTYDMTTYNSACNPQTQYALYPGTWSYKYPVAGQPNSVVSLHSYDVETHKIKDIALPDSRIEYIPHIKYGPNAESLVVATLNRDQNHYEIYSVNPKSTVSRSIYVEESKTWINPASYEDLYIGQDYFVVNSWKSGYNQLYKINYNGVQVAQLTSGDFDVTEYYGTDADGNYYYQVAAPTPLDRTVKRVDKKGRTTDLSPSKGFSSAVFSPNMAYLMLSHSSTTQPPVYTLVSSSGKEIRTVEDNSDYKSRFISKVANREFFTMESNGNTLNGYIIKPENFNASKKYPVIMYQYSGPGSQEVLDKWSVDWQDAFAKAGYVVACVDGRGTGGRGREFCDVVYRSLGYYETIDQLAAAQYVASLPYIDKSRIGIFGWSYGGYETLMAATDKSAIYKAAVAVAPVTDWRFYDSIYAERYMLTPQQNEDGYNQSAPITRAASLNCNLLMMYGTADDNVHPANTIEFVSQLQQAGKLCDMLIFPNMNHSINGCNSRAVVYGKMLDWFNKNL